MSKWKQKVKLLTEEGLKKAIDMDNMELRELFGLMGNREAGHMRVLIEREFVARQAA